MSAGRLLLLRAAVSRVGRGQLYSTTAESGSTIDMGYLFSLLDRPPERPPEMRMTPKRWPDIKVSSSVFKLDMNEHRLEKMQEGDSKLIDSTLGLGNDELWPPLQEEDGETDSLQEVVEERLGGGDQRMEENSLRRIEGMLRSIEHNPIGGTARSPNADVRYLAQMDEVYFQNLKSKTLVSVLSKAFEFTDEAVEEAVGTPIEVTQLVEDEKVPIIMPTFVLALGGPDLHLVEYGQLQGLSTLYGIESCGSRSKLERQLVKYFTETLNRGQSVTRISVLFEDEQLKPFTKKLRSIGDPITWTDEQDAKLIQYTERIRMARQEIVQRVDDYLQKHNVHPVGPAKPDESASLWEVVSKEFPGMTPNACRKHWLLLNRMREMDLSKK